MKNKKGVKLTRLQVQMKTMKKIQPLYQNKQGDKFHAEVNRVINKMRNEITQIKEKQGGIMEKTFK